MFQLWQIAWKFQPADKGVVGHTFDADDLGYPYNKLLQTVVFEYDTTVGGPITLQMDTLTGILGETWNYNVAQFSLGNGRGKTEFPIAPDTIVKMVRVYPSSLPNAGYKQWAYHFEFQKYPPDFIEVTPWQDASSPDSKEPSWLWLDADTNGVPAAVTLQNESGTVMVVSHTGTTDDRKRNYPIPVDTHAKMWRILPLAGAGGSYQSFGWSFERWHAFDLTGTSDPPEVIFATPWSDWGYPYPKLARNLILTINTNGVPCSIQLQGDGVTLQTFNVTSTFTTRRVVIACNANLSATLWRLILTPGVGGIAQLWAWSMEVIKEPAAVTQWSAYSQSLGYGFYRLFFQFWLDYNCAVPVNVTFTSSTGAITHQFPAQSRGVVQRFYFPTVWGSGLNKTVLTDISIASSDGVTPFQVWADASGIEWLPLGQDRHSGFRKSVLSEFMQIPI
jgi:hypothetical protein